VPYSRAEARALTRSFGGHRGDQPAQILLVTDHPEVTNPLGAVSDRAGQDRQHPGPVMHQQPA
jgi:hypothetical protein